MRHSLQPLSGELIQGWSVVGWPALTGCFAAPELSEENCHDEQLKPEKVLTFWGGELKICCEMSW